MKLWLKRNALWFFPLVFLATLVAYLLLRDGREPVQIADTSDTSDVVTPPTPQAPPETTVRHKARTKVRVTIPPSDKPASVEVEVVDHSVTEIVGSDEAKRSPTAGDLHKPLLRHTVFPEVSPHATPPLKEGRFSVGLGANVDPSLAIGGHANLGYRWERLYATGGVWADQNFDFGLAFGADFRVWKRLCVGAQFGSGGKIMAGLSWRWD